MQKISNENSKKRVYKAAALMLAAVVVLATFAVFPAYGTDSDGTTLRLWYDEPASSTSSVTDSNGVWQSATLPIGNGKLGANIYGELKTEHLTVNEETLWSGGRGSVSNYDGGNVSHTDSEWTSWVSQVKNGSFNAEQMAGDSSSSSGYYNGYQALGDLYITDSNAPSSTPSNYYRELNLSTGVSTTYYTYNGVEYTRSYFADHDNNVIVVRYASTGSGKLSTTASFTTKQSGSSTASVSGSVGYIVCKGTVSNNGLMHNTQIAVVPSGGSVSVSGSGIVVSGADSVTFILTAATDYSAAFTSGSTSWYYRTGETQTELYSRVNGILASAVNKGYDTLYSDHETDYTELFGRVSVNLGGVSTLTTDALLSAYSAGSATTAQRRFLETLQYQYGRYLLIAGSREDSQVVTTLQGVWNNNNSAPWYSDIHTNINLEMNYWLSGTGNLSECLKALTSYMNAMYEPGNYTVTSYTDADTGMMMHTQNTPFGYTSPGWSISTWGWSPSASTWLLQNCYDYYEYTKDTAYLSDEIFPLLLKQCEMYRQLLETDDEGKYVFPIAYSPEHGSVTYGNTYEQSIIWQLFEDTIEAAYDLGYAKDSVIYFAKGLKLSDIEDIFANLKGIETGTNSIGSYIKEWYSESYYGQYGESNHRHISQLLGAYPGNMLTTDELKTAVANTLTLRGTNTVSGWSLAQRACTWAAVGNGESAYTYVKYVLTNGVMKNLWGYHSYGGYGGDGKAFQIDANYGYSAAVNEMLLQSNYDYIDLLPAIPTAWSTGSFSGLLAEGGFAVNLSWENSAVKKLSITSNAGGSCSVKYTVPDGCILKDSNGNNISYVEKDGIVTFDTTFGVTYTFESEPSAPSVSVSKDENGNIVITWGVEEGHSYTIYRKKVSD